MKKINNKTKEFLLKKTTERWVEDNQGMVNDYTDICHDILIFKMMWGIDIGIILKSPEEKGGRKLGLKDN